MKITNVSGKTKSRMIETVPVELIDGGARDSLEARLSCMVQALDLIAINASASANSLPACCRKGSSRQFSKAVTSYGPIPSSRGSCSEAVLGHKSAQAYRVLRIQGVGRREPFGPRLSSNKLVEQGCNVM